MKNKVKKHLLLVCLLTLVMFVTGCKQEALETDVGTMTLISKQDNPFISLLSGNVGGVEIHAPAQTKKLTVWFDAYAYAKRVTHKEVGTVFVDNAENKKSSNLKCQLVWGQFDNMTSEDETAQLLEPIVVALESEGTSVRFPALDVKKYAYNYTVNNSESMGESEEIKINTPIVVSSWGKGDVALSSMDLADILRKENLTNEATYLLYVVLSDE